MKKEHLIIIVPRGGSLEEDLSLSSVYKKRSQSISTTYFVYEGVSSPKDKACQIVSAYNFKEFSLDKEGSYYRLRVRIE